MSAPFVVAAQGTSNQPTIKINDETIATYENGVVTGKGVLGETTATVSVINEEGDEFSVELPVVCEIALGDYLADGDYKTIDFNTLTGNINELSDIFGKEVTLDKAFQGYDELIVENNKIVKGIQGQAFGEPDPIFVKLYTKDEGYMVRLKPYVFKGATEISTEYQFSCYDGLFFNENFELQSIKEHSSPIRLIKF